MHKWLLCVFKCSGIESSVCMSKHILKEVAEKCDQEVDHACCKSRKVFTDDDPVRFRDDN